LHQVQFAALDLNLLRVFDALTEEKSVTRAGARLGLTPSAVSHALNRLRYLLSDDLFVRGPNGMQPTPRATEIAPGLRQGLLQLQQALTPADFAPDSTTRQFTVLCGDYVSALLLPGIMVRLRAEAPNAGLRIRPAGSHIVEELDSGRADLALGGFGRMPERFVSELLFSDTMVWTLRADHPAAGKPLTLARLAELRHLIVAPGEDAPAADGVVTDHGLERRVLRDDAAAFAEAADARGLNRKVSLTVPNGLIAPDIVANSDIAALLPRRIALSYSERYGLKLFDPPYPSPPFDIVALWHKALGDQPALAWLRGVIAEVAATL
jgi:DNA-binding transcriptional LysR family regulator